MAVNEVERIKLEERARLQARTEYEQEQRRTALGKLNYALNSPLGIFLLSTLLVTGGGFLLENMISKAQENAFRLERIDSELMARFDEFQEEMKRQENLSPPVYSSVTEVITNDTAVLHTEFNRKDVLSMIEGRIKYGSPSFSLRKT